MARKNKTLGKLLIVAGIGLGGYYLYRVGDEKGWWASLMPSSTSPTMPTTPAGSTAPGTGADPTAAAVDTALGVISWLQKNNGTVAEIIDNMTASGTPIDEVPTTTKPKPNITGAGAAGGAIAGLSAADMAWNAFGAYVPIWLGTSKAAPEITHQVNVGLTHAIGQETGLDKGIRTLMTYHGPFLVNSKTHQCYNLGGQKITCPSPDDVKGIEKHSYEAFLAGVKE